jgi:hypothetical protein
MDPLLTQLGELSNVTGWTVAVLVVIMLLTGTLIPRYVLNRIVKEYERREALWQSLVETATKRAETAEQQLRHVAVPTAAVAARTFESMSPAKE